MRTVRTKVYKFDELSKPAQKTAIESFRDVNVDYEWWDTVYDDAKEIALLMGIEIDKIYFSGFSSQGDGACFEGSFSNKENILTSIKEYAPIDEKLHSIAEEVERLYKTYKISGTVKQSGHYSHEYCTSFDIEDTDELNDEDYAKMEDEVIQAMRTYMKWIYRQLEADYDYQTTDEAIKETIVANEYEFTQDGKPFNK